jgi:hypothetical protein
MLARLRQGMKFQDPKNDTWVIRPSEKILSGSMMEKEAKKAENYLQRVRDDHPDTPWALIAQQELAIPLGWEWDETFTNVNPPPKPPTPGGEHHLRYKVQTIKLDERRNWGTSRSDKSDACTRIRVHYSE